MGFAEVEHEPAAEIAGESDSEAFGDLEIGRLEEIESVSDGFQNNRVKRIHRVEPTSKMLPSSSRRC